MSNLPNDYFLKDIVEKLSFPWLVGTEGEQKAQEIIESELNSIGLMNFHKEPFIYTSFFMNFLLRIYNSLIGLLIICIIILHFLKLRSCILCGYVLHRFNMRGKAFKHVSAEI